jgi:CAAX protease family protein
VQNDDPRDFTPQTVPYSGRKTLWLFILGTAAGFTGLTWIIAYFVAERSLRDLFPMHFTPAEQLLTGTGFGTVFALVALILMRMMICLKPLRDLSYDLYRLIRPGTLELIFISLAAGWGEELFFRGLLQPYIGMTLTSVLFSIGHTGFRFKSKSHYQYLVTLFTISLGLGLLYRYVGLIAAMTAHSVWDMVILGGFKRKDTRAQKRSITEVL